LAEDDLSSAAFLLNKVRASFFNFLASFKLLLRNANFEGVRLSNHNIILFTVIFLYDGYLYFLFLFFFIALKLPLSIWNSFSKLFLDLFLNLVILQVD